MDIFVRQTCVVGRMPDGTVKFDKNEECPTPSFCDNCDFCPSQSPISMAIWFTRRVRFSSLGKD